MEAKNGEVISKLKANLAKIEKSIGISKEKMKSPREVEFLPDIYFSLAELYIEKARFLYALKLEEKSGTPMEEIDFTAEKRVKQEAIETLQSLLDRYPKYAQRDRVLFAIAHEYREINDNTKAMQFYKEITTKYPESLFWAESQFLLGMIFFEKKDYEFAKEQFEKVLTQSRGIFHSQALFKIGQCEIFADQYLRAMLSFEKAIRAFQPASEGGLAKNENKDLREEILLASVVPWTDLKTEDLAQNPRFLNGIEYYRGLAFDKASFRRVLQRLARRLSVKSRFSESAQMQYELVRLSSDPQQRLDAFEGYYLSMKQAKNDFFPTGIETDLHETFKALQLSGLDYKKYEPAFRDIVTKLHKNNLSTHRNEVSMALAQLYEDYLIFFPKTKFTDDMKTNLAEVYFKSDKLIEASLVFSDLARVSKNAKKAQEFYQSALQSLEKSFEKAGDQTVLERFQARAIYREVAAIYLKTSQDRVDKARVSFNLAKTFYDEKDFAKAVNTFRAHITNYPNEAQTNEAVLLLLDTYYIRDDLKGLVQEGNRLLSQGGMRSETKKRVAELVQQAKLKEVKSLAGDFSSKNYAKDIIKFAKSNKGSTLGESALFEAFTALKARNDEKAFEVGEDFLASFPKSQKNKEVLLTMTQMALISVDMRRGQKYLAAFAQMFPDDKQSSSYLQQAAQIAEQTGDLKEAARIYSQVRNSEKEAGIYALASEWKELRQVAGKISGVTGTYYSGLASYRLGEKEAGLNLLRGLSNSSGGDIVSRGQIGHASYIVAFEDLQKFVALSAREAFTPQVLKGKIAAFQEVERQVQSILKLGVGRWSMAALYLQGKLNLEMVQYLRNVSPPPGMPMDQLKKVLDPQIKKYESSADSVFSQCLKVGEENDVFTLFVEGCRKRGAILVSEAQDMQRNGSSGARSVAADSFSDLRKKIYSDPRNINYIKPLVAAHVAKGDYFGAMAVLGRLVEIEPQNVTWKAEMGIVAMYMNNLDEAFVLLNEAYSKNQANKSAVWGLKGLYGRFNYKNKLAGFSAKAKSLGRPQGITHPWME